MDKVQAGQVEKVKAAEEVTRRNVQMILDYTNETRKMLLELREFFDRLQNAFLNLKKRQDEQERQMALLLQRDAAGGTKR